MAKSKQSSSSSKKSSSKNGSSQVYNSKNDTWVKRDPSTGQFTDVKSDTPFKGVTKEK